MAAADYRHCDVCDTKVFYDSNLNYEWSCDEDWHVPFRTNGTPQVGERRHQMRLDFLGDWSVICGNCAKTHKTIVVPIPESDTGGGGGWRVGEHTKTPRQLIRSALINACIAETTIGSIAARNAELESIGDDLLAGLVPLLTREPVSNAYTLPISPAPTGAAGVNEPVSDAYKLPRVVEALIAAAEAYEKKFGHFQDYRLSMCDDAFPTDKVERAVVVAVRQYRAALAATTASGEG